MGIMRTLVILGNIHSSHYSYSSHYSHSSHYFHSSHYSHNDQRD